MFARELVTVIYDRIEELDFGYESDNSTEDTWRAALDIAVATGLLTNEQRANIEIEDRNQKTIERFLRRLADIRRWNALTPEQQERERFMRESFQSQSHIMREIYYNSVLSLGFKGPGFA